MIQLIATDQEIKKKFYALQSFEDLAELLEVKHSHLFFVIYRLSQKQRYRHFEIPKKNGGTRRISSPVDSLKIIQQKLKQVLDVVYTPKVATMGFVKTRNIKTNALPHKVKSRKLKFVFNIDIKDFFPSIHYGRVKGLFLSTPYNLPENIAKLLTQICCFEGKLPQGAPTSPVISNMICSKLDTQLLRLAQSGRCTYTRYADDITFSTSMSRFPSSIAIRDTGQVILGSKLAQIMSENNFIVNENKIRLSQETSRQEITGLTVNRFPNVNRKYIRQIRAILHDWALNGPDIAQINYFKKSLGKHRSPNKHELSLKSILRGKIEFVGMIRGKDDPTYNLFMRKLIQLDSSIHFEAYHMTAEKRKIFLSYARENHDQVHEIYLKLKESGYQPWMDTEDIPGGTGWQREIDKAINKTDFFILILSKKSWKKRGVLQKELKSALEKMEEKMEDDIFIIPLQIEACEIPESINHINVIPYFQLNGWNRLTQALQEGIKRLNS